MRITSGIAGIAIASAVVLGLGACSGAADETEDAASTESAAEDQAVTETEEPAEDDAASASGQPSWANPVSTGGELLTTVELENGITVEMYQVGTTEATETGNFVDPDTNEPLIDVGDEIVVVNYVVTNDGDPIDLGASFVDIETRYDDWPWMQGMDGITDDEVYASMGVSDDVIATGQFSDDNVYTFGTGESYSIAENFIYQEGSPFTIDVSVTPVDENGDLVHDEKVEAEGTGSTV